MQISRYIIFLLFLLCSTIYAEAQTQKNSWMIGGNAHIRYEAANTPTWNTDLNPNVGYFTGNNFALGLGISLAFSSAKSTSNAGISGSLDGQPVAISKISQSTIGVAPFIRGYIGSGKFRPFLQAQAGLSREYYTTLYRTIPQRKSHHTEYKALISGSVGISYFVSEHIGIEALLNGIYNGDNLRRFPATSIGLYFGIQFYLPKK